MRVAVDALNLRNDRRGMGRVVRSVLSEAQREGVAITLLGVEQPVRSAARRGAYDVIWYPWNGIRFTAAAPSLAHIHDTFALHERVNWIARRRVQRPLQRAAREAGRIATDSSWSAQQIERELHVPAERILTIPLEPDAFFSPGEIESPGDLPPEPYVLMVGAGEPRKNARFFIQAFADAFTGRDVRLVVVGTLAPDAEREARERNVALQIESGIDDIRLRDLYRGAACVAVPSLAEGFGLVVVEAQACGAPVVSSNASSLPEAAGDAALLVDPHDRAGWGSALRQVVEDEKVALRLRGLGIARFGAGRRNESARAILAALHDLADHRT